MKPTINVLILLLLSISLYAQDTLEVEEDYSQYENMAALPSDYKVKTFATQKVLGQSPTKLVYAGYEIVAPHTFTADAINSSFNVPALPRYAAEENNIQVSHGIRGETNVPILSRNNIILNFTGLYSEQRYRFENVPNNLTSNPLNLTLSDGSIRTLSAGLTLFKPFDAKNFMIFQVQGDYAGTWNILNWHNPKHIKISAAAIYGRKPHDRLMWGVGIARTYRVGEQNYIPVVLLNYTSKSQKWGIEALAPARGDFRYSFNSRNILKVGAELEGMSYYITAKNNFYNQDNTSLRDIELRRGELRARVIYERPIYKFLWLTAQIGYRINWDYNVDNGEFFRGFFGDQPFVQQNNLGNAFYGSAGIMLVSP